MGIWREYELHLFSVRKSNFLPDSEKVNTFSSGFYSYNQVLSIDSEVESGLVF